MCISRLVAVTLFRRKFFLCWKKLPNMFFFCKLRSQHVVCRSGSDSSDSRCLTSFLWRMFITRSFLVKIANFCGHFCFLCSSWFTSQLDSLRRRRKKKLQLRFITILISFHWHWQKNLYFRFLEHFVSCVTSFEPDSSSFVSIYFHHSQADGSIVRNGKEIEEDSAKNVTKF